jgi:patatin-like phospholipase/acyl hydrolase
MAKKIIKKKTAKQKCYHCTQLLTEEERKTHDCWTTTEEKLTENLPENLMEAWQRLRESVLEFGEQRIYASHKSIMFAKKHCYFFVRPKKNVLEVCFFLQKAVKNPLILKSQASSKTKVAHLVKIIHRDQVEPPLTKWLQEAYEYCKS